jgi:hypothetical protein
MYTLTNTSTILRSDGAYIPADPKNCDYQEYLEWVALGNIPTPVPAPTAQQQRDAIQSQIDSLESATHMNRFVREAMLLISVQQAAGLGLTEPQLYAANIGYKKIKDLDTQITLLRSQIV